MTLDSEVFLSLSGSEIIAAFQHYPIVRRYSQNGILINEFRMNSKILNELEKYNDKKDFTNPRPRVLNLPVLVEGISVLGDRLFILLGLPRLEILEYGLDGKPRNTYYSDIPKEIIRMWRLIVTEEEDGLRFYVSTTTYEEDAIYIFSAGGVVSN
jgi:hypothetical protein